MISDADVVGLRDVNQHWIEAACESPIEVMYALALFDEAQGSNDPRIPIVFMPWDRVAQIQANLNVAKRNHVFVAVMQQRFGRFRLDFCIYHRAIARDVRLVVECDGHAYHDRTKKQASRDRERDRRLLRDDYRVARFTGSDINRDASRCARESLQLVRAA